jgi:hypothetical protein
MGFGWEAVNIQQAQGMFSMMQELHFWEFTLAIVYVSR